jgi:hypothetical protein
MSLQNMHNPGEETWLALCTDFSASSSLITLAYAFGSRLVAKGF